MSTSLLRMDVLLEAIQGMTRAVMYAAVSLSYANIMRGTILVVLALTEFEAA